MVEVRSNPYDFTKPITNPALLAGREKELERIEYYLNQAIAEQPKFYNIALIGKRNLGKTSLLNITKHLIEKKRILGVKISLNKEMVANHMLLYREIVDGILTEGQNFDMYKGLGGWFSKRVKRIGGSADVEISLPGAKVRFSGSKDSEKSEISQQLLSQTMQEFLYEAQKKQLKGIAILFDECDLLAESQGLLQKLRNIVQNLIGYIFIFTGTEDMFSSISDVFSPIRRSFITITVENFKQIEQTRECILKPLSDDEKKIVDQSSILDIHRFTAGSPYEITLVAHHMYRRYKLENSPTIKLTVDVLDDVLSEIDRLRLEGHHEIASKIRGCFPPSLKILVSLLSLQGCSAEELAWYLLLDKLDNLTAKIVKNDVDYNNILIHSLIDSDIIIQDNERLSISGDNFDRLYLRYYALSKGVSSYLFPSGDPIITIGNRIDLLLREGVKDYDITMVYDKVEGIDGKVFSIGSGKTSKSAGPLSIIISPYERQKRLYEDSETTIRFRINVGYLKNGFVLQYTMRNIEDKGLVESRINSLKEKLSMAGIKVIFDDEITLHNRGMELIQEEEFEKSIEYFDKSIEMNPRSGMPLLGKAAALFGNHQYPDAYDECEKAIAIEPRWSQAWELKGRCLFHLGDYWKSIDCFNKSTDFDPENWIAWDNKGRAYLNLKEYQKAKSCFETVLQAIPHKRDMLLPYVVTLRELEENEKALQTIEIVLKESPDDYSALANKGIILSRSKRFDEALDPLRKVAEKYPDDAFALFELALALLESGNIVESIRFFEDTLKLDPKLGTAWYNKACALARLDKVEKAIQSLKSAIELDEYFLELAKTDSDFDTIRNNVGFRKIIEKSD